MLSVRVLPLDFDGFPLALCECLEAIARPEVTFQLDPPELALLNTVVPKRPLDYIMFVELSFPAELLTRCFRVVGARDLRECGQQVQSLATCDWCLCVC